jgi:hypothetical protein
VHINFPFEHYFQMFFQRKSQPFHQENDWPLWIIWPYLIWIVIRIHDFIIVYLCRRKRIIPASHLKKIETKTNLFIDLRYGIIRMFLTLISTNITKAQVLLQLLRPEEDYQLVKELECFLSSKNNSITPHFCIYTTWK